jgi:hypothetical protein
MKSKSNIHLSVGSSSILMIFVVLCLTTFGMLSYVTANADSKISTKNAETVQNYYKANQLAQTKLEQLDSALFTAKSDAKQAVDEGTCDGLKNKSLYQSSSEVQPIFNSNLSKNEKYAICYQIFCKLLLSKSSGVVMEAAQDGNDEIKCSFTAEADQNRQIQVKLTVNSYPSAERYKITEEKLISTQDNAADASSEETFQLWQGSSKAQ